MEEKPNVMETSSQCARLGLVACSGVLADICSKSFPAVSGGSWLFGGVLSGGDCPSTCTAV